MAINTTEFLADTLLRSIRRKAFMPLNDETFTDTDVLEMATEELRDYVVPTLKSINEEFLIRVQDYTVASQQDNKVYVLPERCSAEVLKDVQYSDGSGGFIPLSRIEPENSFRFGTSGLSTGGSVYYYLQDDQVILTAVPSFTTLRIRYFMRPNKLVKVADALTVSSFDAGLRFITTTIDTDTFTAFGTSGVVDIISAKPGFRTKSLDLQLSIDSGSGPTYTLVATIPAGEQNPVPGDYICLAGTSCLPQVPVEVHPLLAQRVAMRMLEGKNAAGYSLVAGELLATEQRVRSLLSHRVEGGSRFIHNFASAAWKNFRPLRRIR